ncbi:hypothetical protein KZX29_04165 [Moraxella osloensis]|uniref:host specificity factor TipJ family phage tail protein n=1 Tax=Faucicola osloensis TaxID=34062 RepID=UPI002003E403|nr:host specificity factor TipJ family phage tail protein [Moraxella osloensis]MCK6157991.1 hypothetical protein [Moraxella osloensis]
MNIFRKPRELIVIRNPFEPQEFEQYKGHDLDALIRQAFPQGINDSVRFYHGNLLKEVFAERDKQGVDKLLKLDGRIYALIKPMGLTPIDWIVIGVSMLVSVAVSLLMPMPNINQQSAPPSPNNALAQRTNRQRLGGRIPDIFGTVWAFPDLIAPTYSVYIDDTETEFSFLSIGRGYFDVREARDDTTPVEQILGTTVDVFNPYVSLYQTPNKRFGSPYTAKDSELSKLVVKRYTSVNGQVLSPPDNIFSSDTMAAKSNGTITATDTNFIGQFSVGDIIQITDADKLASANGLTDANGAAITYNLNGSFTILTVSNTQLTLDVSGNTEWEKLTTNSDFTSGKFNINTNSNSLWQGWFYADNSGFVDFTHLMLNVVAPNGLYSSGQDGNWRPASIDYLVQAQVIDKDDNILNATSNQFTIKGRLKDKYGNSWTYDEQVRRSAAQTIMIPIPVRQNSTDKVRFRIRRITNTITSRTNTTIQEIRIKDFFSCRYMYGYEQSYDTTIVYVKQRATEGALAVKERKLRLLVQRYVKNWQDNDNLILSNRVDDIIYHIARDEKLANLQSYQIDMTQIKAEIDAVIDNFKTPLCAEFCYTFDDNNVSAEEMLQIVAKAAFSTCYRFNNQLKLLFERSIPVSVAIFNSHNILPDTFDKAESFGNEYDGVIIDYVEPVDDATMTINTSDSITNPKKDKIMGVRNKVQAHMHMMRIWNKLQYSYKSCEFTGGDESGIVIRSNRITVADQSRADVQQGSVENLEMIDNKIVLSTSNRVSLDNTAHTLFVQTVDGNVDAIPCSTLNDYQVILSRLPSGQIAIGHDNVVNAVYQIVKTQDSGRDAYLVSEKSPEKGLTNRLTCINYDERYYQNDSDYQNNLIPTITN